MARWQDRRLAREIAATLGFKLLCLALLWSLFFGDEHRTDVTPETLEQRLVGAEVADTPNRSVIEESGDGA